MGLSELIHPYPDISDVQKFKGLWELIRDIRISTYQMYIIGKNNLNNHISQMNM